MLVEATNKSKCPYRPPYLVTTDGVEDVLDTTGNAMERETASENKKKKYKMISKCTRENKSTLMLTPTDGKYVYASAVITAINGNTLYAENVESLQQM